MGYRSQRRHVRAALKSLRELAAKFESEFGGKSVIKLHAKKLDNVRYPGAMYAFSYESADGNTLTYVASVNTRTGEVWANFGPSLAERGQSHLVLSWYVGIRRLAKVTELEERGVARRLLLPEIKR